MSTHVWVSCGRESIDHQGCCCCCRCRCCCCRCCRRDALRARWDGGRTRGKEKAQEIQTSIGDRRDCGIMTNVQVETDQLTAGLRATSNIWYYVCIKYIYSRCYYTVLHRHHHCTQKAVGWSEKPTNLKWPFSAQERGRERDTINSHFLPIKNGEEI